MRCKCTWTMRRTRSRGRYGTACRRAMTAARAKSFFSTSPIILASLPDPRNRESCPCPFARLNGGISGFWERTGAGSWHVDRILQLHRGRFQCEPDNERQARLGPLGALHRHECGPEVMRVSPDQQLYFGEQRFARLYQLSSYV